LALLAAGSLLAGTAVAQEKKDDKLEKAFFDPQLVLQRARDIGLTPQQRQQIMEAVKKIQTELVPIQLDMAEPAVELLELVDQPQVDEAAAISRADKVLKIENEVKKLQMSLLIRIKNVLTKEQQAKLRAIRDGSGTPKSDSEPEEG
jgi:Spy/CpxP family protein refolding chaperone